MRHRHVVAEREGPRDVLVEAQEVQVASLLQVRLMQPHGRLALQPQLLPDFRALLLLFSLELLSHGIIQSAQINRSIGQYSPIIGFRNLFSRVRTS